jgi:Phosphoinositide phospholipase C, Ca2+-dependent
MKAIFLPFSLLLTGLFTAQAQSDTTKINRLQVIGSHNSYRRAIEPQLIKVLAVKDTLHQLKHIEYDHIPIAEQLDMGLRNLEIDIYPDSKGGRYAHPKGLDMAAGLEQYDPNGEMKKPGFKVFHMPDIDFRTWEYTFEGLLQNLKKWSDAHPGHTPIFITLEPKSGGKSPFGTEPELFTASVFDEMDKVIIKNLGKDKLITPDMVRGKYKTLEEAVLHNNWPALADAKGRFMILLDNNKDLRDLYIKGHPSLKGRAVFTNSEPGTPEAAALFRNDPEDTTISGLVKKGYIIRTRADNSTMEARNNDYTHFEDAKKSGAQIITTDYYLPSKMFTSTYAIKFDDGGYVRINPVNGKR